MRTGGSKGRCTFAYMQTLVAPSARLKTTEVKAQAHFIIYYTHNDYYYWRAISIAFRIVARPLDRYASRVRTRPMRTYSRTARAWHTIPPSTYAVYFYFSPYSCCESDSFVRGWVCFSSALCVAAAAAVVFPLCAWRRTKNAPRS